MARANDLATGRYDLILYGNHPDALAGHSIAMGDVCDFRNFMSAVIKKEAFDKHAAAIAAATKATNASVIAAAEPGRDVVHRWDRAPERRRRRRLRFRGGGAGRDEKESRRGAEDGERLRRRGRGAVPALDRRALRGRADRRPWMVKTCWALLALVIVQGILGGWQVLWWTDPDGVNHTPNIMQAYRLFRCRDGWITMAIASDPQWQACCLTWNPIILNGLMTIRFASI